MDRVAGKERTGYPSGAGARGEARASTGSGSGNRCGHNPTAPRAFAPPQQHRPRPKILQRAIERVQDYFDQPALLPILNQAHNPERQQRSERREACVGVLSVLLHYLDLVTMRVIIPRDDDHVQGITTQRIAELLGMGLRRVERAMHDLKAAGICGVFPIVVEIAEGEYVGAAAIRTLPTSLFDVLGLGPWLKRERQKAYERQQRRQRSQMPTSKAKGQIDILIRSIEAKMAAAAAALMPGGKVTALEEAPASIDSRLAAEILATPEYQVLKQEHPDKGIRELLALYLEIYPRPRGPP